MTSATNVRAIRDAKRTAAKDRDTETTVIRTLMSTVDGRRWMWLRLAEAQVFVETDSLDPMTLAYAKGIRREGLRLLQIVNRFAADAYVRMVNENTTNPIQENDDGGSADDTDDE